MEYHFAGAREWKRIAHRRHAIAHDSVIDARALWFDGGLGPERVVAQGLESMTLPVAAIVRKPVSAEQLEASRLLMAGTMLFGLAAVVRRAM